MEVWFFGGLKVFFSGRGFNFLFSRLSVAFKSTQEESHKTSGDCLKTIIKRLVIISVILTLTGLIILILGKRRYNQCLG